MSDQQQVNANTGGGYGYASDETKPYLGFGGNFGNTFLKKFEWIPNGGKDGVEQEALDIIFSINGVEKSYRKFPITQVFDRENNNAIITDPEHPAFKEERLAFSAIITHILHCFIPDRETIKLAFTRPINSFKEYVNIAASILPKDFATKPLDIFLQYQWQPGKNSDRTYLEFPKKMAYGPWLVAAVPGNWKEVRVPNPDDKLPEALMYIDETQIINGQPAKHPFVKNGWFMNSSFAKQTKSDGTSSDTAADNAVIASAAAATQADGANKASAW